MRRLNLQRGLTLIELMVAFAIASLLALTAAPYFADYGINARLREAGSVAYGETLFAQSEAIKRNRTVSISTAADGTITVADTSGATPVTLRTRVVSSDVVLPAASVTFNSAGWPTPLEATSIDLAHASMTCDNDHRCPRLRIEAGGAVRLCGNKNSC
jgi:type IV fimbrial biogenesis protein FimT